MNIINNFLRFPLSHENEDSDIQFEKNNLRRLNSLFEGNEYSRKFMRAYPKAKVNQIWSVKQEYLDYSGELQKTNHLMMVILTSNSENLDEETQFVRGCPISPFIQMATEKDQKCEDESVVGFPFLIEVWNEQPMLLDILDKYVGDYYTDLKDDVVSLNAVQNSFREIEISNARYLNHSIIAYTKEMERAEDFSFSVDLCCDSFVKTIHMPIQNIRNPKIISLPEREEYAAVAKHGNVISDDASIDFSNTELPFKIEIRKKSGRFVVTIIPKVEVSLTNANNEEIKGISNSERVVFDNLCKGLYNIKSPIVEKTVIIRLK